MRRLFLILALLWPTALAAQILPPGPTTITVIDSGTACVTAPTACATFNIQNATSVALDISGTWTGTLTFEGSANGGTFNSILVTNTATGAKVTTTTANGTFSVPNGGFIIVRARATATVTGTATVSATRGFATSNVAVPNFPATFGTGDLLYASTPSTVAGIADVAVGQVLVSGGVGVVPAYSANPTASTFTANQPNITTVSTDGFIAANATAASAGVPVQQSPRIRLRSNVWNTTSVAANNTNDWWIESVPVSGTVPSGLLQFASSLNGGATTFPMTLGSAGNASLASILLSGNLQTTGGFLFSAAGVGLAGSGSTIVSAPANGQTNFVNGGGTSGFGIDGNTDAVAKFRTRAQTGYATVDALGYNLAGVPAVVSTAPTVTSGFGSGTPGTIVTGSTAFAFRVTVGTNAGGTSGVIGLPTATNFWNCFMSDQTTPLDITRQTSSSASSATFTTTVAWTTGDVLLGICHGS